MEESLLREVRIPMAAPLDDDPSLKTQCPSRSEQLLEALSPFGRVVVVSHVNPDPDALAGMLALSTLLKHERPDLEVVLTVDGMIARAENRMMVDYLPIPLVPVESAAIDSRSAVVMLDSQPRTGRHASEALVPTVVIDHHETGGDLSGVAFRDIRQNVGATCTILVGYLIERSIAVSPKLATALFYGIDSEISGYPRESSPLDDGAQVWLFPKADKDLLARIRNPKLPRSHFATFGQAIADATLHGNAVVSWCGGVTQPDIVAELADFFVRFEVVNWVLTGGVYDDLLKLSIRTSPLGLHAGETLRNAVNGLGSAGGHDKRAGGAIPLKGASQEAAKALFFSVRDRLFAAFSMSDQPGQPLVSRPSKQLSS